MKTSVRRSLGLAWILFCGALARGGAWDDTNSIPIIRATTGEAKTYAKRAQSSLCLQNLGSIRLAAQIYANDNNGRLPQAWADFAPQSTRLSPEKLYCPADVERPARSNWAEVDFDAISYLLEAPLLAPTPPVVLARCRIHDNVALTDFKTQVARPYETRLLIGSREGGMLPVLSTLAGMRESALRVNCQNNLIQLRLAFTRFANDHLGKLPSSFSELTNDLSSPKLLFCPGETWKTVPASFAEVNFAVVSYSLDAPGQPEEPAKRILTCRLHGSYADSSGWMKAGTNWYPSPLIVGHPLNLTVRPGATATFAVLTGDAASGPVRFQWRRLQPFDANGDAFTNTVELAGETNRVFSRPQVTTADEGYYDVVVSDDLGRSQLSQIASLHVAEVASVTQVPGWQERVCLNNLRDIARTSEMFAGQAERMPDSLAETRPYLGWPLALFCPRDTARTAPDSWEALGAANTSYEFVPGVDVESTNLLATCRVHGFQINNRGKFVDRPDSPLRPQFTVEPGADRKAVLLSVRGLAGSFGQIQTSTNLVNWKIVDAVQLTTEPFVVTNQVAPAEPVRYFRAQTF